MTLTPACPPAVASPCPDTHRRLRCVLIGQTLILVALLSLLLGAIRWAQGAMAPTYDEQNHVTRGLAILRTGDWRLSLHHPPVANVLEALPVAWRGWDGFSTAHPSWRTLAIWPIARATVWHHPAHGVRLIQTARGPVLAFTLLFAVVVFAWARELFGPWGGLLALSVVVLDPAVLAHGGLATTDMPVAATMLLACYLLWRGWRQPTRWRLLGAGVAMGIALGTKFSALAILPMSLLLVLLTPAPVPAPTAPRRDGRAVVRVLFLVWGIAALTVWGLYGFAVEPLGKKPGVPLPTTASWIERSPVPALQYFRGVRTVLLEKTRHSAYLLGTTSETGHNWWYYTLVVLGVKTPLPTLLLWLGFGIVLLHPTARRHLGLATPALPALGGALACFLALAVISGAMNQGIRHLLPLTGLLAILVGAWAPLAQRSGVLRAGVLLLVGLQAWSVLRVGPDFLAYFNEAAGGPQDGWRVLVDSNCDWGQDLGRLATWHRAHGHPPLAFSYFGTTPPEAYGLQCVSLLGTGLMHDRGARIDLRTYQGYLAISVTNLVNDASLCGVDYRPLLRHTPVAHAGHTIHIYHLPEQPPRPLD